LKKGGAVLSLNPALQLTRLHIIQTAEQGLGGLVFLCNIGIQATKVEVTRCEGVELVQGLCGNPLSMVAAQDNDAHLGPEVVRVETGEVNNANALSVGHDDLTELPIDVYVALLLFEVLPDNVVREGYIIGSPLPQCGVVLYLIYEF